MFFQLLSLQLCLSRVNIRIFTSDKNCGAVEALLDLTSSDACAAVAFAALLLSLL